MTKRVFEINTYLLGKMGWITYSQTRGIRIGNSIHKAVTNLPIAFEDDPYVRFFYDDKSKLVCYIIKELSPSEKQKSQNLYKFIIVDYQSVVEDNKNPKIKKLEFNSNTKLIELIIKYEACSEVYQRHFKINKLLK